MKLNTLNSVLRRQRLQAGVTLVEVLIVVAIMAMLAGGVAFAYLLGCRRRASRPRRRARWRSARWFSCGRRTTAATARACLS